MKARKWWFNRLKMNHWDITLRRVLYTILLFQVRIKVSWTLRRTLKTTPTPKKRKTLCLSSRKASRNGTFRFSFKIKIYKSLQERKKITLLKVCLRDTPRIPKLTTGLSNNWWTLLRILRNHSTMKKNKI